MAIKFEVALPAKAALDVVSREFTLQIGSDEPKTKTLTGAEIEASQGPFIGAQDSAVRGEIVDIDDAGNRSESSTFEAVLIDTIAPPKPGQMGLRVLDEVPDELPPVEDPVVEDPVVEDPVVEDPVSEDPVTEDPVSEDPVTEDPVSEDPGASTEDENQGA